MKLKPKDLAPFRNKALEISKLTDKELEMFSEFTFCSYEIRKFNIQKIRERDYVILDIENLMLLFDNSEFTVIPFSDILKSLKIIQKKLK